MKRFDPLFYLVSAPARDFSSPTAWLNYIQEAVEGGVTLVQFREKKLPDFESAVLAEQLKSRLRPYGVPLIVNDSPKLCRSLGADGVHLGQGDGDPRRARDFLGPGAVIGLSLESLVDLEKFLQNEQERYVDYVAVSPVFATASKADLGEPLGLTGLSTIKNKVSVPVVAIGGITLANVLSVRQAGADGVAVVSALLAKPREAARQFKNLLLETEPTEVSGWSLPSC